MRRPWLLVLGWAHLLRDENPAVLAPALRRSAFAEEGLTQAAKYRYADGFDTAEDHSHALEHFRGPDIADRVAVVANFHRGASLAWLQREGRLRVDEVGVCDHALWHDPNLLCGRRHLGEALAWLEWIVQHYDGLPSYVAFLHGPEVSWHTSVAGVAARVLAATPADIEMLADANCFWTEDTGAVSQGSEEGPGLDALYGALWGTTFLHAWQQWKMGSRAYRCCAESVVSRDAIRSKPKEIYEELVTLIQRTPDQPWGWVYERTWQNLFQKPLAFPAEEVVKRLRAQNFAAPTWKKLRARSKRRARGRKRKHRGSAASLAATVAAQRTCPPEGIEPTILHYEAPR